MDKVIQYIHDTQKVNTYVLTTDQVKQLINQKIERAKIFSVTIKKQFLVA
jgi:hypothetical protein